MATELLLEARDVYKTFGLNRVLKGISLTLRPGEVLALIGGNGAGKSTLMKIIMGIYKPDAGTFSIQGHEISGLTPNKAMRAGIYMVPQEPMIFPHMTITDNVLMGFRGRRSELRARLNDVYRLINCNIDLSRLGMSLSIAEQQMVELLRGLMRESRILILDEPTSALTFDEVKTLFRIVRDLREQGIGVIYITHRLAEVFEIADQIAVMSDGRVTLSGNVGDFTREKLVAALLPPGSRSTDKKLQRRYDKVRSARGQPVLELDKFSGYGFQDISFSVCEGEIVGVAGVVGAGRTELACAVFGREKPLSGTVKLLGQDITGLPTDDIIALGINYVPEDRRLNGLYGISSVTANISSALLSNAQTGEGWLLNETAEAAVADKYIREFRIKVTSRSQEAGSLSGGNQQKIVIARALATEPRLVILDEPTRGIDAGARGDVYQIIRELRDRGVALMIISSDMEEIIELVDRAVVFCRGRISATLERADINQQSLTAASFGVRQSQERSHA